MYSNVPNVAEGGELEEKEIQKLIDYHQSGLDQYCQHMSPSAQYLEGQTIKVLQELLRRKE